MRRVGWLGMTVSVGFVLLLLWLILDGDPEGDSSVFAYVAQGLLDGDAPWVDRWDHKGPAIYLVNAAGLWLTPGSWMGLHVLEMIALVGAGLLGFATLRPAVGTPASLVAMLIAGLTVAALVAPGNFTEEWTLLPQFAALFLFARVAARPTIDRGTAVAIVAIGALGAVAFLFRQNLVGVWLAIGLYWLILGPARVRRLALATAGGLSVLALAAVVVFASGTWDGFADAVLEYNRIYTGALDPAALLAASVAWLHESGRIYVGWQVVPVLALGWFAALLAAVRPAAADPGTSVLARWAALVIPIEIGLLSVSDRAYTHYYLALIPALAVVTALVVDHVYRYFAGPTPASRAARSTAFVVAALGVAWLTLVVVGPGPTAIKAARPYQLNLHHSAAELIRTRTAPGETVLIWGGEPLVLLLAERTAPTRYFYQLPLLTEGYASDERILAVIDELESRPPALVIETHDPAYPPLDPLARAGFEPTSEYRADPALLQPIFDFIAAGYVRADDIGPWAMYEQR